MMHVKGIAAALLTGLLLVSPLADAIAASDATEMVYRANLGRAEDVKLLVDKGVSPDLTDPNGVPILALAAGRKDEEALNVVKALLRAKADINAVDTQGQTALFYAGKSGNGEVVNYLLEKGIDYNLMNDNGDTARTVAYRAGQPKMVETIDAFLVRQSEKVAKQYEDLNRELAVRYKQLDEDAQKQAEASQQAAAQAQQQIDEQQNSANAAQQELQKQQEQINQKQAEETESIEERRASPKFAKGMEGLAFQNCAFQYWSYCKDAKQTSEFPPDQLKRTIAAYKKQVISYTQTLQEYFALRPRYLDRISSDARSRIFYELDVMPSKIYRFEHGVCKQADMLARCQETAKLWGEKFTPPKAARSSGKGGKSSAAGTKPGKQRK
jgi:hypothetical protein